MWFSYLFNNTKKVHPLNIPDKEVCEYFNNYEEENIELNKAMSTTNMSTTNMSTSNMSASNISVDNYSEVTSDQPPNIILDSLTPCELVLYNQMIKHNISSFTIRYRRNSYYKESVVIAMLPPLSELCHFNGKNVKIQLVAIDEFGSNFTCQEYINNHDGDFYEYHNLGKLNDNKKEICDEIKAAYLKK